MRRLLDSDFKIVSLLVAEPYLPAVSDADRTATSTCWSSTTATIEQIVGFNFHRGLLGCALRKPRLSLAEIAIVSAPRLTLVACPDVQDPENLGAIFRISAALAIDAVLLGPGCCDPLSRRVLRVSMGAALRVKIIECDDLAAELARCATRLDLQLWAAVIDATATGFDQIARPDRLALAAGQRRSRAARRMGAPCDRAVTIPMVAPGSIRLTLPWRPVFCSII